MADYHHGVRVIEINEGAIPIRTVATAIIGIVCTGDDADNSFFPLNTPKLITNIHGAMAYAGVQGTLKSTLNAIALQCSPVVVVVRVASSPDEGEQTANVCGEVTQTGKYTGIKALLTSETSLGVKPRILAVPGLDNITVANELIATAQNLRAFCYLSACGCENKEQAVQYRSNFGAREAMIIFPDFTGFNTSTKQNEVLNATAYACGLRAKLDSEIGWHKTLSNIPVNGVEGLSSDVFWALQNPNTDAGYLNGKEVTTLIRNKGFRFWGARTCDTSGFFAFENYTRTAQILADTISDASFAFIDKPMNASLIKSIVESVNNKFRELKSGGYIVDATCWFDASLNTPDILKDGRLFIDYDFCPVPSLENLNYQQRITDRYLIDLAGSVAQA